VRLTRDLFVNLLNPFVLDPISRDLWLGNLFVQDTIALSDKLDLIAGLKAEGASFTGVEWLPNVRLAWRPATQTLLWGAVSRSVRTPSRIDRNLILPGFLLGGTFGSERVIAIEAGYRGEPVAATGLSVSLFYNIYDGLRTTESVTSTSLLPVKLANGIKGHSYGIEAWANHRVFPGWRLSAGVSTLHKSFRAKQGHLDIQNGVSLGNDPDFQVMLRSQADLTRDIQFDLQLRAVDSLPKPHVDGYVEADARLAWAVEEDIELFVAGSNLLHKQRDESGDPSRAQLVVRRIAAGTRLRF
jgi:iron complex outermembrane receptor protein